MPQAQGWSERLQMIFASAVQVDRAILFSTAITLDIVTALLAIAVLKPMRRRFLAAPQGV